MKIVTFALSLLFATTQAAVLSKRDSRTSPPSGCLVVRGSSTQSGEYSSLTAAVAALGSGSSDACIFIYSGTYTEQLTINYGGALTIYGYTTDTGTYKSNTVTITHTLSSPDAGSLDASATVLIKGDNTNIYNINIKNGYGKGAQAVALSAQADYLGFYGAGFYGYQDTLYAKSGLQYYSNCYVEGAVDYIFGDATAWFGECTIASNGGGAITAMSRETSSETTWDVFVNCNVKAASGYSDTEDVYLGRPWRVLARVMYQNSDLSNIINPKGWTTMAEGATPIYQEYNNDGDGADTSDREYETAASSALTKTTIFGSGYGDWIDTSY